MLVENRDQLRWRSEGDPVTDLLRRGVLVVDGEEHDYYRSRMNPTLHRSMFSQYVRTMWQKTDEVSANWKESDRLDMLVEMRRIALLILVETLFGVDFGSRMRELWTSILRTLQYISPGAWILWPDVPRPGYSRAIRRLDRYLHEIIRERRTVGGSSNDLLGILVGTDGLSDDVIRDQLLTMLIAGHDTSTALLAWSLYLIGGRPEVLERIQDELQSELGESEPTLESIGRLLYLDQVINETLRLYPPIHIGNRMAARDLEFKGFNIPAGTRVVYSIYLTHRHPAHWTEPEHFVPERFDRQAAERRPRYTFLPFGGGPRNCIGASYAMVEAKVVLARLLQQFDLQLGPAKVRPHMGATLEPRPGVFMRARKRVLTTWASVQVGP